MVYTLVLLRGCGFCCWSCCCFGCCSGCCFGCCSGPCSVALGDRVLLTVLFWVPFWVLFWVLFGANHAKYKAFPSKPNMLSGVMLFFFGCCWPVGNPMEPIHCSTASHLFWFGQWDAAWSSGLALRCAEAAELEGRKGGRESWILSLKDGLFMNISWRWLPAKT